MSNVLAYQNTMAKFIKLQHIITGKNQFHTKKSRILHVSYCKFRCAENNVIMLNNTKHTEDIDY